MLRWAFTLVALALSAASGTSPAAAQAPLHTARVELAGVIPLTSPQRSMFRFGGGGSLAYELRPVSWLGVEARVSGTWVPSSDTSPNDEGYGTYFALPALGVRVYPLARAGVPGLWLGASGALVLTGSLLRPGLEVGLGIELALGSALRLGPFVRYQQAFQTDRALPGWSNGGLLSVGISLAFPGPREAAEPASTDRDGDGILNVVDACPDDPEDFDGFEDADGCPDPDNDGDGVPDTLDRCPNQPGSPANEGCPDHDRDGDGIVDRIDDCPDQPEDVDGFQDADGCPDLDNDGDEVPDALDRCPNEPGTPGNRGCPDPDRDGDSVVDRIDNCPDEPGSVENHGCPSRQLVQIEEEELRIMEIIYFATNRARIQRRSHGLLQNVARVIRAHPEMTRVRVEGHTDERGSRDANLQLSQQRADAVVRFLVEEGGVDAAQVEARGFGPDQPIVPDATEDTDHARNRRVVFRILAR